MTRAPDALDVYGAFLGALPYGKTVAIARRLARQIVDKPGTRSYLVGPDPDRYLSHVRVWLEARGLRWREGREPMNDSREVMAWIEVIP